MKRTQRFALAMGLFSSVVLGLSACTTTPQDGDKSGPTVLSRSVELAEQIDKLPSGTDAVSVEVAPEADAASAAAKTTKLRAVSPLAAGNDLESGETVDVTDRGDYDEILIRTAYYTDAGLGDLIQGVDADIRAIKEVKNHTVEVVRQLSTWVGEPFFGVVYRLSYDKNSDSVIVESRDDLNEIYTRAVCYYDSLGRCVIDGGLYDIGGHNYFSVYYVEGVKWESAFILYADVPGTETRTIMETDLTTGKMTRVDYTLVDGEPVNGYEVLLHENVNGYHTLLRKTVTDEFDFHEIRVYDSLGRRVALGNYFTHNGTRLLNEWDFNVYLYHVTGWDKFILSCPNGSYQCELTIGDETYSKRDNEYTDGEISFNWRPSGSSTDLTSRGWFVEPVIYMEGEIGGGKTVYEAVQALMGSLGLSYEEAFLPVLEEYFTDKSSAFAEWEGFGRKDMTAIADLNGLYESYQCGDMTEAEMQAIFAEPTVYLHEQVEDEELLSLVDFSVSGVASLDGDGTLGLAQITGVAAKSILLAQDREYALVVALKSGGGVWELAHVALTYADEELTFGGLASASLTEILNGLEGDYDLVAYLAVNTAHGGWERVSSLHALVLTEDSAAVLALEDGRVEITASARGTIFTVIRAEKDDE